MNVVKKRMVRKRKRREMGAMKVNVMKERRDNECGRERAERKREVGVK